MIPTDVKIFAECTRAFEMALTESVYIFKPKAGENPRLVNQRGLFTFFYGCESLEDRIQRMFQGEKEAVLVKFQFPESTREEVLNLISHGNINHFSLFPDLLGSSEYCNRMIPWLFDNRNWDEDQLNAGT